MSTRTMSPSSFEAAQWAAVAPTFPAPMMLIFARRMAVILSKDAGRDYGRVVQKCNRGDTEARRQTRRKKSMVFVLRVCLRASSAPRLDLLRCNISPHRGYSLCLLTFGDTHAALLASMD